RMGVGSQIRAEAFRIDGAVIAGSSGEGIELRGDHETAILRRSELDYLLVQEAVRWGTKLVDGTTVKAIEIHRLSSGNNQVAVKTSEATFEADLVINCSGATGKLDRRTTYTGVPSPLPSVAPRAPYASARRLIEQCSRRVRDERMTLHTIMGWYEGVDGCSDVVELFFDEEIRPHYAWIFPETDKRVNIGLCFLPTPGGANARQHFESFIDHRLRQRLRNADLLGKWIGHPVQVSPAAQELVSDGILRAGEAGWLADASTAEGIFHGLVSGRHAGRFSAEHLANGGGTMQSQMRPYQSREQKKLLGRLARGRRLMSLLRTPTLDLPL